MEQKERMILEIIAGVIFLLIIILGTIIVVNASRGSETKITNSFNTYNININQVSGYSMPISSRQYLPSNTDLTNTGTNDKFLNYDSSSRYTVGEGIFGNQVGNYEIYLRNLDYTGGYFKVIYSFEDYYGNVNTESEIDYVGPQKEKKIVLKDVSPSDYKYRNWWYQVQSLTKAPVRNDYNRNGINMIMYPTDPSTRTYSYTN